MEKDYKVAFSEIDITPNFQVELIGCYREDNESKGVLHSLKAQVLLIKEQKTYFCLITIDLIGLTTQLSNELRDRVSAELGTNKANVMLNFSHTHAGPDADDFSALNGEKYFKYLCNQVLKCVHEARKEFLEFKVAWALTETDIGENRREGCEFVDKRLGALRFIDKNNGKIIATILRVTAHANILMNDENSISGDYFSVAREKLKSLFLSPVMLIQGAAGNVKPKGVDTIRGGEYADINRIVDVLIKSASNLEFKLEEAKNIEMLSYDIEYISDVPDEEMAELISSEAYEKCNIQGKDWVNACKNLREKGINTQKKVGEVQFFKINNGCFCGVADEIFTEISYEVQKSTNNPFVFFNGYTNGCSGYIPTKSEWSKGGYETLYSFLIFYPYHGHVMPYREDTSERLVEFIRKKWKDISVDNKMSL